MKKTWNFAGLQPTLRLTVLDMEPSQIHHGGGPKMAYMKTRLPVELLLKYLFLSVSVNKVVDIVDEDICFADQSAVVKEFAGGFESFV